MSKSVISEIDACTYGSEKDQGLFEVAEVVDVLVSNTDRNLSNEGVEVFESLLC